MATALSKVQKSDVTPGLSTMATALSKVQKSDVTPGLSLASAATMAIKYAV
jgi:hypothetical protein